MRPKVKYFLSVRQPYASRLVGGRKEVENRNYPLGCLTNQWVALHVSKTKMTGQVYSSQEKEVMGKIIALVQFRNVSKSECQVNKNITMIVLKM